jgi:hypothetical protein
MKKVANIPAIGYVVMGACNYAARCSMNEHQGHFIDELEPDQWRARRHPSKKTLIELYIDPSVMDSRRRLLCDILFQL